MAETTSDTVRMNREGRCTISQETREVLGIDGEPAILELDVTVKKRLDGDGDG